MNTAPPPGVAAPLEEGMALYSGSMEDIEAELADVAPWPTGAGLAELKASLAELAPPAFIFEPGPDVPCRAEPELWWDPHPAAQVRAAATCDTCPFRAACADHGLAHEKEGIWGGIDAATGKRPTDLCVRGHDAWRARDKGRNRYCYECRTAREAT